MTPTESSTVSAMSVACSIAIEEYTRSRRNLQRFWNLLYATAAATVVTLIVGLIEVMRGDAGTGVAAGVSALVTGGGFAVLIKLKDQAFGELRRAQTAVRTDCVGAVGLRD